MKIKILILMLLFGGTQVYAQTSTKVIRSKSEFMDFSGLPLNDKYGQVSSVKLVYDLEDKSLYYLDSDYYRYHLDFCKKKLGYEVGIDYFNKVNYSDNPNRRFLLANINYYKFMDVYSLEIASVDQMTVSQIFLLYNIVARTTFIGENLKFLLNSTELLNQKDLFSEKVPILSPFDVYKNQNYQSVSKYSRKGVLRFVRNLDSIINDLKPEDIIVIKETPLFLPLVSGIIVTEFQTPLSHLTILGQNREIPICTYKSAFENDYLLSLQNKNVSFSVASDTFKIVSVNSSIASKKKRKKIKLKYDLTVDSLVSVEYLGNKTYKYAGNKASNFGILYKLSRKANFKVPESSFVIPFFFYNDHLYKSGAKALIDSLLANTEMRKDEIFLQNSLAEIRNLIINTAIDSQLLKAVDLQLRQSGTYTRFRFRSSTNAEDAKGFSGAGLYTSKTGKLNDSKKPIDEAIKKVWASLWSYEAFLERESFNINQKDVFMGVLVHRSFPEEAVNGVAITKNLYRADDYGFVINAQLGDESVVKPQPGVICDQFICYPDDAGVIYRNKNSTDIITLSNLNNNTMVMTDLEIQNLAKCLDFIKKYFYYRSYSTKTYIEYGLDIEFKLDNKNRDLYIKQVRIFND